jgi:16S rRNA processing protein RimM
VAGEFYVDGCPLAADRLLSLKTLEWRGARTGLRTVVLTRVHPAAGRLLVTAEGISTREAASALTNGTLWAEPDRLPDPGPGVSYAWQLAGMRVVDAHGRELGTVAEVVFNVGQPLLQLDGPKGKLLPCQPPFMKHVDVAAGVITLDLPPGFEEF